MFKFEPGFKIVAWWKREDYCRVAGKPGIFFHISGYIIDDDILEGIPRKNIYAMRNFIMALRKARRYISKEIRFWNNFFAGSEAKSWDKCLIFFCGRAMGELYFKVVVQFWWILLHGSAMVPTGTAWVEFLQRRFRTVRINIRHHGRTFGHKDQIFTLESNAKKQQTKIMKTFWSKDITPNQPEWMTKQINSKIPTKPNKPNRSLRKLRQVGGCTPSTSTKPSQTSWQAQ